MFTWVFPSTSKHPTMTMHTRLRLIKKANQVGITGKASLVAPRIMRNIVPGVIKDDANRNM